MENKNSHNIKKNENLPAGEWVKTITDEPLSKLDSKIPPGYESPYTIKKMPELKLGDHLGSGKVLEVLGEGGFARVYKIHDENLDLDRAVKVLLPTGKKEVLDRFFTEARITARLDHTNIVKVFRVDELNGFPFIEMEFIDGLSLETMLNERGAFPVFAVCAIGIFIARALSYAHNLNFVLSDKHYKGVIHRDLKPANIMLHLDGRLKLMDFGIARPVETGLHTMGDNIVGTLQYLSPEQLNHKDIDQRTDIYALGAIIYELLCGIKAFPDEGLTDLVNKKATGRYKPFGDLSVSVPKKLSEIVDRCLQVNKDERFENAQTLCDALSKVYTQYTSLQPEIVLKNFMQNPVYSPVESKPDKKKTEYSKPVVSVPQEKQPQQPPRPKFKFPVIHLPKLPKLPKLKFPIHVFISLFQIIKNVFSKIYNGTVGFLKTIGQSFIKLIKVIAAGIIKIRVLANRKFLIVFGGILLTLLLTFFVYTHSKDIGKLFTVIKKEKATVTVPQPVTPAPVTVDSSIKAVIIPELLYPNSEETIKSETLKVSWNLIPEIDSFTVHLASTSEFLDTTLLRTVFQCTSFVTTDFEPGKYYCRVGIPTESQTISWSDPHSFTFSPVYHTPHLLAPSNNDTCNNREVTFKWRRVPRVKSYIINVAADAGFQQMVYNDTNGCLDTFVKIIFYDTLSIPYFWHVRAKNDSTWSLTYTFTVDDNRNYCTEAEKAFRKKKFSNVETAIQKIIPGNPCKDTLLIRLSEIYLEDGNIDKVKQLLTMISSRDKLFYYLYSKTLLDDGKYVEALAELDTAIQSATQFNTFTDSSKVIYLRAGVAQAIYNNGRDKKKGAKAYYAWDEVKKLYNSKQSDERYREALLKMNELYHTDKIFGSVKDTTKTQIVDTVKVTGKKKKNKQSSSLKVK